MQIFKSAKKPREIRRIINPQIMYTVHSLWLERLGRLKNRSTPRAFHLEGVGLMEKVQMGPSNIVPAEGVPGQRAFQRRECTVTLLPRWIYTFEF